MARATTANARRHGYDEKFRIPAYSAEMASSRTGGGDLPTLHMDTLEPTYCEEEVDCRSLHLRVGDSFNDICKNLTPSSDPIIFRIFHGLKEVYSTGACKFGFIPLTVRQSFPLHGGLRSWHN